MNNTPFAIENYKPADFHRLARLCMEAEQIDRTGRYPQPRSLREELGHPGAEPNRNLFIATTTGGTAAGFMSVMPEPAISRVILTGLVHPVYRRQGAATLLFRHCLQRAASLNTAVSHVNITRDNLAAKLFLTGLGFSPVRHFVEFRIDLTRVNYECYRPGLAFRHLKESEITLLTRLQNKCFFNTWGFNSNTEQEIKYRLGLDEAYNRNVILALAGGNAVGYCWSRPLTDTKGTILMLGVDPDCRGRGVGRALLQAGLYDLYTRGMRVVDLTADGLNQEACSLYFSVGFKAWMKTEWYEKIVS